MLGIRESPPQIENRIMARVYVRSITRSSMFQKAPFCLPEPYSDILLKNISFIKTVYFAAITLLY